MDNFDVRPFLLEGLQLSGRKIGTVLLSVAPPMVLKLVATAKKNRCPNREEPSVEANDRSQCVTCARRVCEL